MVAVTPDSPDVWLDAVIWDQAAAVVGLGALLERRRPHIVPRASAATIAASPSRGRLLAPTWLQPHPPSWPTGGVGVSHAVPSGEASTFADPSVVASGAASGLASELASTPPSGVS